MDAIERKQFAEEVASAAKAIKRPWWLTWGIPSAVLAILTFLTSEIYQGISNDLTQNRETDAKQNESLSSITVILEGLKEADQRQAISIASAREDPWTATADSKRTGELLKRIDRNESRIDRNEQTIRSVLIESVEIKTRLKALEK